MPRTLDQTKAVHKFIYEQWVYAHKSQQAIVDMINGDPKLVQLYGEANPSLLNYHVNQIRMELESSIDHDAIEKYTAEYVRFQHTIESEIENVQKIIDLIDIDKEKETWIKLNRLKKEYIETKLKALQDHELPLTIKKLKAQRDHQQKTLRVIKPRTENTDIPQLETSED